MKSHTLWQPDSTWRNYMLKRNTFAVAAVAVGMLLAACSSGSTSGTEAASTAASQPDTAISASMAPSAPLKIGVVTSLTGPAAIYGPPVQATVELAMKQINDLGGVNGQPIEIIIADDGSNPTTGAKAVSKLLEQDGVNALVAMTDSATREGFISQVEESGIPFVYTTLYEGGACLPNMFVIGEVPAQYDPIYKSFVTDVGAKKVFFIGHDYVWPQTVFPLAQKSIESAGGKVVGQELVPFGTSDFGAILKKAQDAGADSIVTALVGADYGAFVKNWRQSGMDKSTKQLSLTMTDDYAQALGAAAAGIYGGFGYFSGVDTPANKAMIDAYKAANPDAFAQNTLTEASYDGIQALAKAANAAGTTEASAVIKALAGIQLPDSPRGALTIDAKTHHANATMHLLVADESGRYSLVKEFPDVSPGEQCSL